MLYPQQNDKRNLLDLSGFWDFKLDPDEVGEAGGWFNGLSTPRSIAVPGSWNEQFQDTRDYMGMAWYACQVYVPGGWQGQRLFIRVGSANYAAKVWVNGTPVGWHEGGHLPFVFDITNQVNVDRPNTIAIQVENYLTPTRVPAGNVSGGGGTAGFMRNYPATTFDFFPYAGLQRPVILFAVPPTHIEDVTVVTDIDGSDGVVTVTVVQQGDAQNGQVQLNDDDISLTADLSFEGDTAQTVLTVPKARLWSPDDPFLYHLTICLTNQPTNQLIDRYTLDIGIRTIAVKGDQVLLNGQPIFMKGFGKHEDFPVAGRGQFNPLIVKDHALLKWMGANSYRTSHYPYAEEQMMMADRDGLLIIDEIPAVSLHFDDGQENMQTRLKMCQQQLDELIGRDKNHPSVIAWSIANEPFPPDMIKRFMGGGQAAELDPATTDFFQTLYDQARQRDPSRLVTLVGVMGGPVEWLAPADVVLINRYWGWYMQGGQLDAGAEFLAQELDGLYETLKKPMIVSEFGTDTIAGMHSDPPEMWSEEYQVEFIRRYLDVAAERPFMAGMHIWNFADFKTAQGINRAGGLNQKGVFTRDRRPKMAAHFLRQRWTQPGSDKPAQVSAANAGETNLPSFAEALAGVAHRLDGQRPGVTTAIKFVLNGEGAYRLFIEDGRTRIEPGDGEAAATLTMQPDDAVKLMAGKLNAMVLITTGRLKAEGDMQALMLLQGMA